MNITLTPKSELTALRHATDVEALLDSALDQNTALQQHNDALVVVLLAVWR